MNAPGAIAVGHGDIPLALYVHLPWCVRKCPYCDFNSHQLKSARPDAGYIDSLLRDFDGELPLIAGRRIDTVFFGGGTPSLFAPEDFERLLKELRLRTRSPMPYASAVLQMYWKISSRWAKK